MNEKTDDHENDDITMFSWPYHVLYVLWCKGSACYAEFGADLTVTDDQVSFYTGADGGSVMEVYGEDSALGESLKLVNPRGDEVTVIKEADGSFTDENGMVYRKSGDSYKDASGCLWDEAL